MARLKGFSVPRKAPSMKGEIIVRTWRGIPVAQKWPKRRTRPLNPKNQEQAEKFLAVTKVNARVNWQQRVAAYEATKGTPFYPRDVLTMTHYGTLFWFLGDDGRRIYSMSNAQTVSESLDVLSQIEGSILTRSGGLWVPVDPGLKNNVLYYPADGAPPEPIGQGPEIGGHHFTSMNPQAIETGNEAIKGRWGEIQIDVRLQQLIPTWSAIAGAVYKVEVWDFDGSKILTKLAESDPVTWGFTGVARRRFFLTQEAILTQGNLYAFLFLRTDATGTTSNQLYFHNGWGSGGWPINDFNGLLAFNTTSLAPNQAFTRKTFASPGCIDGIMVL